MNRGRLKAIVIKEWREALRNRTISWTLGGISFFFLALPLVLAFGAVDVLLPDFEADRGAAKLVEGLARFLPVLLELSPKMRLQVLLLRQFVPLFLLVPVMGAMSIATYSIVGEKSSRSLEPLLATPVSTRELLVGKGLAAALPPVVLTWLLYGLFALAVLLLGSGRLFTLVFDPAALLMIVFVTPLLSVLALGLGVIVSARASDPRSAQQIGGLVVIPLVAIFLANGAGVFLLGPAFAVAGVVLLAALDLLLLYLGTRLFDRERILVRWR